jgi:hypothetical protein
MGRDQRSGGLLPHFNIQHLLYSEIKQFFEAEGVNNKEGYKLKTRVFELYNGKYPNLSELAHSMRIHPAQVYRVREGKRNINQKFIIGAVKAFPGYKFDDLFYVSGGGQDDFR